MHFKRKIIVISLVMCIVLGTVMMSSMAESHNYPYVVDNKNVETAIGYPRQTSGSTKKLRSNIVPAVGTTSIHVYIRNNNTGAQVGHKLFPVQTTTSDLVTTMNNNLYYRVTVRPNTSSFSAGNINCVITNS